jgi:hypothetical protein
MTLPHRPRVMDLARSDSQESRPSSIHQRRLGFVSPRDWDTPPDQALVVPAQRNCICCRPWCACCAAPNTYAMHQPSIPQLRLSAAPMRYYALQFSPYSTEPVHPRTLKNEPSLPEIVVSPSSDLELSPMRRKFSFEELRGQSARSSSLPVTMRKRFSLHNQSISGLDTPQSIAVKRRSMSAQISTRGDAFQPTHLKRHSFNPRLHTNFETQSDPALQRYSFHSSSSYYPSPPTSPEEISPTNSYFSVRSPSLQLHAPQPLSMQKFHPLQTVQERALPPCPLPTLRPFLDYGSEALESPLPVGESSLGPLGAFAAEVHAGFDTYRGQGSMRDIWAHWVAQMETARPGKRRGKVPHGIGLVVEFESPTSEKGVLEGPPS